MVTKEKILNVSLKVFMEVGFLEVSIDYLIKKTGISKGDFYKYYKNKNQLIFAVIEKFLFPHFDNIIRTVDECNGLSKEKLLSIFQKYSETESYFKNNFSINKINYKSIIFFLIEGEKSYIPITNHIIGFNNRLLEKIESVIEQGKRLGEISNTIISKSIAINTLSSLQSSIVLCAMNQNIDIKVLFEINFKYLWNSIKSK